jgi:hypothetical protein
LYTVNNIGSGREMIVRPHHITVCSKVGRGWCRILRSS